MATGRSTRYFMTANPLTLDASVTVADAAKVMRCENVGDVLITRDERLVGVLTDRAIVIRGIAEGYNSHNTPVGDICTQHVNTLSPSDTEDAAVRIMRCTAVRRVPIVDGGRPVGIECEGRARRSTPSASAS